ncbi:MAG: RNA methyltransferase, partial [Phycisphaerae bacterium]
MAQEIISSLDNPRVKDIVRLRQRSGRRRGGPILIDGIRETTRALEAGIRPIEVFYCPSRLKHAEGARLMQTVTWLGTPCTEVTEPVFRKIRYGQRLEGVVATAARPELRLDELWPDDPPLVAAVEGVEKPGNLGAILRS